MLAVATLALTVLPWSAVATPTPSDGAFTIAEDATLKEQLPATDADGHALVYRLVAKPKHGAAYVNEETGSFTYMPEANFHGADAFTFAVAHKDAARDAKGAEGARDTKRTGSITFTVTPVDDPPVVTPLALATQEDVATGAKVTAMDPDGDALVFTVGRPPEHGDAKVDAKGVVTYTPAPNATGADAFTVDVSAGDAKVSVDVTVKIAPVNDAPTASALTVSTREDEPARATVACTDAEGDALSFRSVTNALHGAIVVETNGTFTYTPARNYHGADSFAFDCSDAKLRSKPSTVSVTVAPVDDPPVVQPFALGTQEDTATSGALAVSDQDGDPITFSVAKPPAHGTADVKANGAVTYTPARDYAGDDVFTIDVVGAVRGGEGGARVPVDVRVNVGPVNDAPTASPGAVTTREDEPATGTVACHDVEGDALSFRALTNALHGAVTVDAKGAFTYAPARNYHGADSFTFDCSDGKLRSGGAPVTVTVTPVDDAPVVTPLALGAQEDTATGGTLVASDADGDTISFALAQPPAHGDAKVDAKGAVTYTPARDYAGDDAFTVDVTAGGARVPVAVRAKVAAVNDAPTASPLAITTREDEPVKGSVACTDVEGDALSFRSLTNALHGAITVDAKGAFTYAPARDFHGADSFTFDCSDGKLRSSGAAVTITVTPVDDPPVVAPFALGTQEDIATGGTMSATDVDGDKLAFALGEVAKNGVARVDGRGAVTYAPAKDFAGEDAFTVVITAGPARVTHDVRVKVAAVNDAPLASASVTTGDEDVAITGTVSCDDVEDDPLTYRLEAQPKRGSAVTLDGKTGAFQLALARDWFGDDAFSFSCSDGRATTTGVRTLRIAPTNDAPTVAPLALATTEDIATSAAVRASDVDGDALTYKLGDEPQHGTATIDAKSGRVTYTPARDENGTDAFAVVASDGKAETRADVKVEIAKAPDPPTAQSVSVTAKEDEPYTSALPGRDPDGDALAFAITKNGKLGTATLVDAAKGTWRYLPNANVNGTDEIAYEVSASGQRASGAVTIKVAPVNDAPVANILELTTVEDTPVESALTGSDVDGDALTFALASPPASGVATVTKDRVTFAPARDAVGDVAFTVVARDASAASAPARVVVHVTPANDAPVASGANVSLREDEPARGKLGASDVDGDALTYAIVSPPAHGKVTVTSNKTGAFEYAPEKNWFSTDAFVFSATDASGASAKAVVNLTISAVDDAPVASSIRVLAPRAGKIKAQLSGYDPEGYPVTFRITQQPAFAAVDVNETTGEVTITTTNAGHGTTSFEFVVNDGALTSAPAIVQLDVR